MAYGNSVRITEVGNLVSKKGIHCEPISMHNDIWAGLNYSKRKILLLGESTYGDTDSLPIYIPNWCRRVEKDWTFSRIFNACSGLKAYDASTEERLAFWNGVAFVNFVQCPVGEKRKDRPTTKHFTDAKKALPKILSHLTPRAILIFGREQAAYSRPVIEERGIPCEVSIHPTAWGVKTAILRTAWEKIVSLA